MHIEEGYNEKNKNIHKEVPMKSEELKQGYIRSAYEIIEEEGIKAISIRRLAKKQGCNSASLYRCFQNLEELLLYVGLYYLKEYLDELKKYENAYDSWEEQFFKMWECFAKYSLANPEIFDNLFFGQYNDKLGYIMKDYYKMFPEEINQFDKELQIVFLSGKLESRNIMILEKCVEEGIPADSVELLNHIGMQLYKGYLKDVLDKEKSNMAIELDNIIDEFIVCYKSIFKKFKIRQE